MPSIDRFDQTDHATVDPLEGLLGYQMRRASAWILADFSRALGNLDLRPAEASIMMLIEANPDITQSEIGRMLGIKRANMAPFTGALADRNLIDKIQADGRSHALRLTAKGVAVAHEIANRIAVHESGFLKHLPPAERADLAATIRRIWDVNGPR